MQIDPSGCRRFRDWPVSSALILIALNAAAEKTNNRQASSKWAKTAMSLKYLPMSFDNEPLEQFPGHAHPYHTVKQVLDPLEPALLFRIDKVVKAGCWVQDSIETHARVGAMLSELRLRSRDNRW